MVQTGELLLKCLRNGMMFPEMLWETISERDLQDISLERLKALLPLRLRRANIIDPDWEKLAEWPEEVARPDSFWRGQTCDVCRQPECECILTCFFEPRQSWIISIRVSV